MNLGITRALAGVNSFTELGLLLRSGRHTRAGSIREGPRRCLTP